MFLEEPFRKTHVIYKKIPGFLISGSRAGFYILFISSILDARVGTGANTVADIGANSNVSTRRAGFCRRLGARRPDSH